MTVQDAQREYPAYSIIIRLCGYLRVNKDDKKQLSSCVQHLWYYDMLWISIDSQDKWREHHL